MSCNCGCGCNPCSQTQPNTVECETLPSQIENFTLQFFGEMVKTEENGVVRWSLPCGLDVGLENNPRGVDEGLACYFLRLFQDGITGATGPKGDPGTPGTNGHNAYTVTLAGFPQPTLGTPNIAVITAANPAILPGLYIFIATSGWYLVNATDNTGTLFLTLVKEVPGASGVITAGKLVVPSGFPGASVTGPTGPQGPQGATGPQSPSFTEQNGFYFTTVGTDYSLQIVYAGLNFVTSEPLHLLQALNGIYELFVIINVIGKAGIAPTDLISFKLFNTANLSDLQGSEQTISNLIVGERKQVILSTLYVTPAANQTVQVYGKATTADVAAAVALQTTFRFMRVA